MQRHPQTYLKRTFALLLGTSSSGIAIASGSAVLPDELSNITIHGTDCEAVTLAGGTWHNVATTSIGDRVKVQGGNISEERVELNVIEHDDPACCPTRAASRI